MQRAGLVGVIVALVPLYSALHSWRRSDLWWETRVHETVIAVACVVFAWLLVSWKFVAMSVKYRMQGTRRTWIRLSGWTRDRSRPGRYLEGEGHAAIKGMRRERSRYKHGRRNESGLEVVERPGLTDIRPRRKRFLASLLHLPDFTARPSMSPASSPPSALR